MATSKVSSKAPAKVPAKSLAKAPSKALGTGAAPPAASSPYSTYPLPELALLWKRKELTAEQMMGHLLQHLAELDQRVHKIEGSRAVGQ